MKEKEFILDDTDRLLSIEEAAARLRTSPTMIGRLIDAGLLGVLRFRRDRRIPKSLLNQFIREHVNEDIYDTLEAAEKSA